MENGNGKVHVVLAMFGGCLDDARVARTAKKAGEIEQALCKEYGVPHGPKRRQRYYDNGGENEVRHWVGVEVER